MSDDVTHNLPNDLLQQILDGVGALGKRLDGMDSRLEALEAKSYDTKPLWERALAGLAEVKQETAEIKQEVAEVKQDLAEVKQGLAEVKQEVAEVKQEVSEIKQDLVEIKQEVAEIKRELVEVNRRLDSMERRFSVLNDDVLYMRAEHRKLEDRVERLESPRS